MICVYKNVSYQWLKSEGFPFVCSSWFRKNTITDDRTRKVDELNSAVHVSTFITVLPGKLLLSVLFRYTQRYTSAVLNHGVQGTEL